MSILQVTTRITRRYLENKTRSDLAQMYLDLLDQEERLTKCLRDVLPLAEAYLKDAPAHPDNAKLEEARGWVRNE